MNRIGIDVGGVIIESDTDEANSIFSENYLNSPEVINSFSSIKKIVKQFKPENVFLVSKCSSNVQERTKNWLEQKNFFEITNLRRENIHFCLKREEKKIISNKLNLNFFIDDRFTVLKHLANDKDKTLFLFKPKKDELGLFLNENIKLNLVHSWDEIINYLKSFS